MKKRNYNIGFGMPIISDEGLLNDHDKELNELREEVTSLKDEIERLKDDIMCLKANIDKDDGYCD